MGIITILCTLLLIASYLAISAFLDLVSGLVLSCEECGPDGKALVKPLIQLRFVMSIPVIITGALLVFAHYRRWSQKFVVGLLLLFIVSFICLIVSYRLIEHEILIIFSR